MSISVRRWSEVSPAERERILKRSESDISDAVEAVRPVLESVRAEGDRSLVAYTAQFDHADIASRPLKVTEREFSEAEKKLSPRVKEALAFVIANVRRFHELQKPAGVEFTEIRPGIFGGERATPIDSCGLYIPKGRGSFPSMLYMLAVPALIAGVPRVAVVSPPNPDGTADPACLYAARLCGISEYYRVGGAQAIAALAYGTESISPVVKIVGPGSRYVTAAKRLVSDLIDIGIPAGPSESIVLADGTANPRLVALDLMIEAEHGADSQALLVTADTALARAVADEVERLIPTIPEPRRTFVSAVVSGYGGIILVDGMEDAVALVNEFAPEHLQIQSSSPFDYLSLIRNAGEILLGDHVPFSAANYATGPNAVLPTGGRAKSWGPVSVRDFMKHQSIVYCTEQGYRSLAPHVAALADYEGFVTHGNAIKLRDAARQEKDAGTT